MDNAIVENRGKDIVSGKFLPANCYGRKRKFTDEEIDVEAIELIKHANKDDTLVLADHYALRGYTYDDVWEWKKTHIPFREAEKTAKQLIGARREREGLRGNLDSALVRSTLANYDPEHRQMLREQAQKIDINQNKEGLQISIVSYTSGDNQT